MLTDLAVRAAIVDLDGTPLRFTPHDFRRIFATETVNSGLPIHIAAKLLGHLDLNTTQGYLAVYPQEVIRHFRRFVDQRRARRPSEEYREPTDGEWAEFRDHFSLRKVALGTCDRPYGTPCQHEHAPLTELVLGFRQVIGGSSESPASLAA
jgi:Phage integrase family